MTLVDITVIVFINATDAQPTDCLLQQCWMHFQTANKYQNIFRKLTEVMTVHKVQYLNLSFFFDGTYSPDFVNPQLDKTHAYKIENIHRNKTYQYQR